MNVKKTIKKIAAIAIGTAMLGSTMLSASATLEQFPAPFVANGMANVQLVIGSGSTDDYLGALDIATSLQAASVTSVAVAGGATTATIDNGFSFGKSSDRLVLGDTLLDQKTKLTDSDLPNLLADGVLSDDDGTDYDYSQNMEFGDQSVVFDKDNSDLETPTLRLTLEDGSALWTYTVEFTGDAVDVATLDDSESITLMGKSFTFDTTSTDSKLILYGADTTSFLELNTPKTITAEGKSYTLEIVGANSDATDPTIILDVNGVRKTVSQSSSTTINGLDVYVKDLFVTNIPTLAASANVFVGSEKVELTDGAEVKINDQSVSGLIVDFASASDASEGFSITYTPTDLNKDVAGFDETDYLLAGKSLSDPLFGTFDVLFQGANYALDDAAKTPVKIEGGNKDLKLTFTNDDGDSYTAALYKSDSLGNFDIYNAMNSGKGFVGPLDAVNNYEVDKNDIFFVNEASGLKTNTVFYEVTSSDKGDDLLLNSDDKVTIKNLMTGSSKTYKAGDTLGDSDVVVDEITAATDSLVALDFTGVIADVYVDGGYHYVTLPAYDASDSAFDLVLTENSDGVFTAGIDSSVTVAVNVNSDDEFTATLTDRGVISDDDDNFDYELTDYGTYAKGEAQDNKYVNLYVPKDDDGEVSYNVFVAPTDATVTTSASGTTTDKVNPIAVGVAVRDADVNIANPSKNLIVIGGTCINSVSAKLKNVAANTCGEASGLKPGEATIELFTLDNGKVAMLVAGWEAVDTQAAARAVATKAPGLTGNKVTLSVTSANQYTIKQ